MGGIFEWNAESRGFASQSEEGSQLSLLGCEVSSRSSKSSAWRYDLDLVHSLTIQD
jgi:hypothetical protein